MVRYHYREGVSLQKRRARWLLWVIGLIIIAAALYVTAVYLAPQLVTVPFTPLTADATDNKIKNSKAGQFGDRLFLPQINVDVPIVEGGATNQSSDHAWQQNTSLGDPEKGGNFVLAASKFTLALTPPAARAQSPFYNLGKLNSGDELTLDFKGKRYVYKIDRTFDIQPGDDVEQKSDDYRLTLYAANGAGDALRGRALSAMRISPAIDQQVNATE